VAASARKCRPGRVVHAPHLHGTGGASDAGRGPVEPGHRRRSGGRPRHLQKHVSHDLEALEPAAPALAEDPLRRGSRNGLAAASRSCLPARLRACQRPAGLGSSHCLSPRGCAFLSLHATKRPPGRASPESALRVESSVAASGTKVPLAGTNPGLLAAAGSPGGGGAPGGARRLGPGRGRLPAPVPARAGGSARRLRWAYRRTMDGWGR